MSNSSEVYKGEDGTIAHYNDLRADILDETTGHEHTGNGDGNKIPTSGFEDDSVTEVKAQSLYNTITGFNFIY